MLAAPSAPATNHHRKHPENERDNASQRRDGALYSSIRLLATVCLCAHRSICGKNTLGAEAQSKRARAAIDKGAERPTVMDLFCGAGGLSLGFDGAGYQIALGIDRDALCGSTFAQALPDARALVADIAALPPGVLPDRIDVLLGGCPWKDLGTDSATDGFLRVLESIRPLWLILEDARGTLAFREGARAQRVIDVLGEQGYTVLAKVLCAADYGVPQSSERNIFHRQQNRRPACLS